MHPKRVEQGDWGYAKGQDGGRYEGLRYSESMTGSESMTLERAPGFLVRREVAKRQKDEESQSLPCQACLPSMLLARSRTTQ